MTDTVTGHGISEKIDTSDLVYQEIYDATIADQSTCFLCGMQFSNADLCKQHQHHVHMKWVSKDNIKEKNLGNLILYQYFFLELCNTVLLYKFFF